MAYYSVMQYMPDRARAEGINVGVVVFDELIGVLVDVNRTAYRVERFFNKAHAARAADAAQNMADRIANENFKTKAEVDHFITSRAGVIQLTPLRWCRAEPLLREERLAELMDKMVYAE